jgi:hypothetical protein
MAMHLEQNRAKSRMCRHHEAGRCNYGLECTFAHSATELRPPRGPEYHTLAKRMKADVASAAEDRLSNSSHRRAPQVSTVPYSLRLLRQTRSASFGKDFRRLLVFERPDVREETALQNAADVDLHRSPASRVRLPLAGGCSAEHAVAHSASVRTCVQTSMRECLTQLTNHTGMLHLEARLGVVTLSKASGDGENYAGAEGEEPTVEIDEPAADIDEPAVDAVDDAGTDMSIDMAIDAVTERGVIEWTSPCLVKARTDGDGPSLANERAMRPGAGSGSSP